MEKRYPLPRAYKWFIVASVIPVIAWVVFVQTTASHSHLPSPVQRDLLTLRFLTNELLGAEQIPLDSDGRVDPLALIVRDDRRDYSLCHSDRRGLGPSVAEFAARDYSNFPWARAKGPVDPEGPVRPLLWEPEPMPDGLRLVAFDDGTVRVLDEAEFEKLAVR